MPPNPPPPPPRKGFSASVVVKQSSNVDLLASIQRGTKLKKALVSNDRSAPLVQKAISVAEGNSVEKTANPLFSSGFPKLKETGGGIREEVERKLFERLSAERKVEKEESEKTERKEPDRTERRVERLERIEPERKETRFQRNEIPQKSARETVRNSLNESAVNKSQRQEFSAPVRNSPLPTPNTHKFDLSYIPKTTPRIQWPPKCSYPSGEREGLNKFIKNPAQFHIEDPKAKASESKAILSKALQTAIGREDFESCIELKTAMKSIETSTSTEQIERIMKRLDRVLQLP